MFVNDNAFDKEVDGSCDEGGRSGKGTSGSIKFDRGEACTVAKWIQRCGSTERNEKPLSKLV